MGLLTAVKTQNVKVIVTYEPGSSFLFPEGEVPQPMPSSGSTLEAVAVPMQDFMQLTKIPIVIYYGDFIPAEPNPNPGQDGWLVRLEMAKLWRDVVNEHGGDVTLVHLHEIGIICNTHFPFSDLNNVEIADLMSEWPVYSPETNQILDIQRYGNPVAKPDPRKARFDVIEKA